MLPPLRKEAATRDTSSRWRLPHFGTLKETMTTPIPQQPPPCSVSGTFSWKFLDWSEFSLKSGWGTVESFGRRVCGLATLALLCAAVNPVWMLSQTPMQYEMRADLKAATARLETLESRLASVPTDIAVMKEQINRQNATMESFSNRVWALIAGLLAWAARQMFIEFGGKERRKT